jgi:hypothetical protein
MVQLTATRSATSSARAAIACFLRGNWRRYWASVRCERSTGPLSVSTRYGLAGRDPTRLSLFSFLTLAKK